MFPRSSRFQANISRPWPNARPTVSAIRPLRSRRRGGHLVRQAIQDGLLRELDELIGHDGTVDLVCDPGMEIPLELENRTLTLTELIEALQYKRSWSDVNSNAKAA